MNPTVFISYLPDTKVLAEELVRALETNGVSCWAAYKDLHPGQNRTEELERAASSADWFTMIARPRGQSTTWQEYEWRLALMKTWDDRAKRILPVVVGEGSISALRQWVPLQIPDPPVSSAWTDEVLRVIQSAAPRLTDQMDPDLVHQREQRFAAMQAETDDLWQRESHERPVGSKP